MGNARNQAGDDQDCAPLHSHAHRIGRSAIEQHPEHTIAPPVSSSKKVSSAGRCDSMARMLHVTDAIVLDDREVDERFVRASGPGGQNVNKVSSAVELRFNIPASSLAPDVKERLIALAGNRVTADGDLIIDSREHRTQAQNREAARARLIALLQHAARRPKRRKATRPGAAARQRRLTEKKHRGDIKAARRGRRDE